MDAHAAGQRFSQHFFAFADHFLHLFAELPVIGQANKPLDQRIFAAFYSYTHGSFSNFRIF